MSRPFVGDGTQVISRLRTATPQQVILQVTIAEVSRSLVRQIGVNLAKPAIRTGGIPASASQPRHATSSSADAERCRRRRRAGLASTSITSAYHRRAGRLLGLDVAGALDLAETDGLVTTLAEPNLTALSGETASFLAGGEFPIPISQSLGAVTIEYKQFGVSLAFTPTVLANGRISMRVRPEVSELSSEGAIRLNGFDVPALTMRRAETTVELGSGQSFMIAGLLRNNGNNTIDATPVPRRPADPRRAVPLDQLPPRRDRAGDHRHALSGEAGRCERRSRCRPTAIARRDDCRARSRRPGACGDTGETAPESRPSTAPQTVDAGRRRRRQRPAGRRPAAAAGPGGAAGPPRCRRRQTAANAQPGFNF